MATSVTEHRLRNLANPWFGFGAAQLTAAAVAGFSGKNVLEVTTNSGTIVRKKLEEDKNVENKSSRDLSQQDRPLLDEREPETEDGQHPVKAVSEIIQNT